MHADLTGLRAVLPDGGDVIGTFTDQVPPATDVDARSRVFFFRIPGAP